MASKRKSIQAEQQTDVGEWAESLPNAYLLCRDMGHEWEPYRAWHDSEISGYRRVMRCRRCKTERSQALTMSGHVVTSAYDYSDGYTAPKGTGVLYGPDRDRLRLASILRLVEATPIDNGKRSRRSA